MKRQVRRGTFETNSSSVHSINMCSKSNYDRWKNGELSFDRWSNRLVEVTDEIQKSIDDDNCKYLTYEQFNDYGYVGGYVDYETFYEEHVTENGDTVVAFGYYGHD